ncbi:unnamed protein product [Rotaria sp. Silwood1]|nr:unnamed protein product [Rotaria sp. Silwood1]CAF1593141.1 unnamed protein product [Rotaria sp. Silwood1]CAF3821789.1 unnamed protein product [Rotaria sp. Silwood1]CAF4658083.1 unnamed protein product [Rotaria sp. Silwood1]
MVAALYGYENIVRILFKHCEPEYQVELEGIMYLDDQTTLEGITALYCACYRAHFTVARLLIDAGGANVNHGTLNEPYHPLLIHATRINRLDIVQFLIENGYVDVNETRSTTRAKSTALVWAIRQNHLSVVKYLLEKGANVDYYCTTNFSSKFTTPLILAVHDGNLELVRILCIAGADTTVKNKAGDTLLAIAVKKEHWSIIHFLLEQSIINIDDVELAILFLIESRLFPIDENKLYKHLYFALQQRLAIQSPKVCRQPLAIYNYYQECQTIEELNSIKTDSNRIWIEVLLVLERILIPRKDPKLAKIFEQQPLTSAEQTVLCNWISRLCQQWQMPSDRQTIVHLCISGNTYGLSYRHSSNTARYLRFPNESALRLVLACGHRWLDLDAVESIMNNTALHLLCHQSENQTMIKLLLNAGAHIDCMNRYGLTPLMYATSQETKAFLKSKSTPTHLKCLCASMIARQRLNTSDLGPATSKLNIFISLHGCSVTKSDCK